MQVTPAILPHSFEELRQKMDRICVVAGRVQIDLCDGKMGRETTWMPEGTEKLPYLDTIDYEFDVMVYDWRTILPNILSLHIGRIVMHVDSFTEEDCVEIANICSGKQITLGLAVSNDVELEHFDELIRIVRHKYPTIFIQVMGIKHIGEQGQFFDESCIERILHLKKTFGDLTIQVDGGMRPETAPKVKEAGAETIVVGSYLMRHDDICEAYSELSSIE